MQNQKLTWGIWVSTKATLIFVVREVAVGRCCGVVLFFDIDPDYMAKK